MLWQGIVLTLCLLCVKVLGLGDVSQGGLGSFSLANMVIAHLQEEEKVLLPHHTLQEGKLASWY